MVVLVGACEQKGVSVPSSHKRVWYHLLVQFQQQRHVGGHVRQRVVLQRLEPLRRHGEWGVSKGRTQRGWRGDSTCAGTAATATDSFPST